MNQKINLNDRIGDGESKFAVESERRQIPKFVGQRDGSVVEIESVVRHRNIVPCPISIQPIVEILFYSFNLMNFLIFFLNEEKFCNYVETVSPQNAEFHPVVFHRWT